MLAQYLAHQSSLEGRSEALESQALTSPACGYLLTSVSAMLLPRWALAYRYLRWVSRRSKSLEESLQNDRSRGCPRASSFSRWRACWPALQPAAALSKKRHLSSLSRSLFRRNRRLPASTSKPVTGWVLKPAPLAFRAALVSGGRPC